jgi:enoyl-CoA hydratase
MIGEAVPTVTIESVEPFITMIRLDRPERLNAINYDLVCELHDALDVVAGDEDCKVVILTGAGRGFCAGLDLRDWGTPPGPGEHPHAKVGIDGQAFMANLTVHMRNTPQVIIGAVNGPAFGGGLSLACATDVRIAAESARFCSAFIRTGLTGTDIGITYLLPRLIGTSRAFDLIFSGREIGAAEAEHLGLVSQVVPDAEFMDRVLDYARIVASYTRVGLVMTKEVLWHNVDNPSMTAAIALENRNQNIANRSPEVQEYMSAYRNRTTGPRGAARPAR